MICIGIKCYIFESSFIVKLFFYFDFCVIKVIFNMYLYYIFFFMNIYIDKFYLLVNKYKICIQYDFKNVGICIIKKNKYIDIYIKYFYELILM